MKKAGYLVLHTFFCRSRPVLRCLTGWLLSAFLLLTPGCKKNAPTPESAPSVPPTTEAAPDYAWRVLRYVKTHSEAPPGYVGGRTFQNLEKLLPQKSAAGKTIRYREWDVFPKTPGKNRGPERIVTGSDGSAYYTKTHYRSFQTMEMGH